MINILYQSFSAAQGDRIIWKLDSQRLRILCYHGVCEDGLQAQPWLPHFFVTRTSFEAQLRYLRETAHVLRLAEAAARLAEGSLPPRAVSITFDDGYANNLRIALPLLEKYGLPATIFLSSSYIESGEFYPFLKLKLIQLAGGQGLPEYKTNPVDVVIREADVRWRELRARFTPEQFDTLRPMTVGELQEVHSNLLDFGAHSHTHCILRNENDGRREAEIQTSVCKVAEWTGRPARLFSYPNGESGDFEEIDKRALRSSGVEIAVTGISGANGRSADPLALKRYPLGLYHTFPHFRAEVAGFRSTVLGIARRLSS